MRTWLFSPSLLSASTASRARADPEQCCWGVPELLGGCELDGASKCDRGKVFLFGTPQTHPGKLVFDQFSSTADPLFGRSKNCIQKITQLCIYRFRYVLCICPKYVFMQVNTM